MVYTKVQKFMLYSLGKWFDEANNKIKNKTLQVSISKVHFIELVRNAEIKVTQPRALYKNLETLEKKKLIEYKSKELILTKKGKKLYEQIKVDLKPYIVVYKKLKEKSPTSYTKKIQTVFR